MVDTPVGSDEPIPALVERRGRLSVRWATRSEAPWFTKLRGNAGGRNAPAGDLVEYPLPAIGSSLAGVAAGWRNAHRADP